MKTDDHQLMRSVELLRSFASVQKNLFCFVQRSAVENGLSIPQYNILMTLISHTEMTQKTLGEKTYLPKSTLSQAVDGLVKEGLLERQQVEGNRREMLLSLNEKGIERIKTIHLQESGIHRVVQKVLDALEPGEAERLLETHARIASLLETIEPKEQLK
ncbi:MarR family winged helix-turn-helix transcriptional regulator [Planococcus sp. YIM B11945]|uniref:MarR family winged helix-turn-helix transcriptional regulator n=1 Tax=Planococcus sp. YIM B11945 TaxID=3435410 RepID=UPI003D7D84EF